MFDGYGSYELVIERLAAISADGEWADDAAIAEHEVGLLLVSHAGRTQAEAYAHAAERIARYEAQGFIVSPFEAPGQWYADRPTDGVQLVLTLDWVSGDLYGGSRAASSGLPGRE